MALAGAVAIDELAQVLKPEGAALQGMVDVGAVVVIPDLFGCSALVGGAVVEEEDVGLHSLSIEDARRQSQDGVEICGLHESLADGLAGATFEKDVVGQDHGGLAGGFEKRADVLEKVELLVRSRRPEVLAVVDEVLLLLLAFLIGEGHAALLAEGRIGEHVVDTSGRLGDQGVGWGNAAIAIDLPDVVEKEVHQAEAAGTGNDLVAVEGVVFEEFLLAFVELVVADQIVVGRKEEAACAAGWIGDGPARFGGHTFDHGGDQGPRGEILTSSGFGVLGVLFEDALVDVALGVGAERDPLGVIDHLDESAKLGGVLDLVLRLGEDLAEHAFTFAEFAQGLDVVHFQFRALEAFERLPSVFLWDSNIPLVGRLTVFVSHLEEDQVGELFEVVAVADAVVAEGVAEAPDFGDDGFGGHISKFES